MTHQESRLKFLFNVFSKTKSLLREGYNVEWCGISISEIEVSKKNNIIRLTYDKTDIIEDIFKPTMKYCLMINENLSSLKNIIKMNLVISKVYNINNIIYHKKSKNTSLTQRV